MRHFRKAMESVRPTITEDLMSYYEQIQDQFKGGAREGLSPDTRDGRLGFQ
jgi:transitional endoplasmic reticulum ATPase